MDLQVFFTLISTVFVFTLVTSALIRRGKNSRIWYLIALLIITILWELLIVAANQKTGVQIGLIINKGVFLFVPIYLLTFFQLIKTFTDKRRSFTSILFYISIVFSITASLSPFLVEDIRFNQQFSIYDVVRGPLYPYYLISVLLDVVIIFYNLYKLLKVSKGREKLQIEFLIYGTGFLVVATLITNAILPITTGSSIYSTLSPLWVSVWVAVLFYTTLRHRLFDISYIIGRVVYYLISAVFLYGEFYLFLFIGRQFLGGNTTPQAFIFGIPMALTIAISTQILNEKVVLKVSNFFMYSKYDPEETLRLLSKEMSPLLDIEKVLQIATKSIADPLHPTFIKFFIKSKFERDIIFTSDEQTKKINDNEIATAIDVLVKNDLTNQIIYEEIIENPIIGNPGVKKAVETLSKFNIKVLQIIPSKKSKLSYLTLGEKENNIAYTQQDVDFLQALNSVLSVGIDRSLLYEETQAFAATLQKEVDKATADLRIANEQLKQLDSLKDDLISIAGHELRTPATIITNNVYLLEQNQKNTAKRLEYIKRIKEGVRREVEMITNLLEAARFGKKTIALEPVEVDIALIASTAAKELGYLAKEKKLDLTYVTSKDKELIDAIQKDGFILKPNQHFATDKVPAQADKSRIREVMDNLITNAVKYTDKGSIKIWVTEDKDNVCFYIKDTGIGIRDADKKNLFEKFSRIQNRNGSGLVRPGGTGLGLYVAKEIITMHGGEIGVESKGIPDEGSLFYFCIPKKFKGTIKQSEAAGGTSYTE